jgi:hypothetical protein
MASNDFIIDLVEKLAEENIEYILVAVQKGKTEHKSNAFYNITTVDGAEMIMTTTEVVFEDIGNNTHTDDIEIDWSSRDDDDSDEKKSRPDKK